MENPTLNQYPAPLSQLCVRSAFPPGVHYESNVLLSLSAVCYDAAAALPCDSHGLCFCVYENACALLYMCWWGVCCHRHKTIKKSGGFFLQKQPFSLAATKASPGIQKYSSSSSSSGTTAAALQAHAFVPVVTVYVRVAGAQQQEIEPRQHTTTSTRPEQQAVQHLIPGSRSTPQAHSSSKISTL